MLLDRFDIADMKKTAAGSRPLIVTKENARKAFFHKMNRHGNQKGSANTTRLSRRGHIARGNSFAGNQYGQRVVIKINPVKNRAKGAAAGRGAKNLYQHIRYISRSKAGEEGGKALLFDQAKEVEGLDFFKLCEQDRHHFRMIVSPENGHAIKDFQGYVRQLMSRVEKDLGTKLEWVSAVHYDTDDIHAHVIVRGKNDRGEDLVIGRDYISTGIRGRAQEIATELLGERSLEEIRKSMEKEIDALRVTSLDRFIAKQANKDQAIDVRKVNNFGKSPHYEGLIKGRLKYLQTAGLAVESPPGVFKLKENYQDILAGIAQRNDIIKRLYPRVGPELDDLSVYSLRAAEGQEIEGRIRDKGFTDEMTDRKYIVVRDFRERLHYVPVGEIRQYEQLESGSVVRVRPGDQSTGKADYNIKLMADRNHGIYDLEKHKKYVEEELSYIEEEAQGRYMDAHIKRLDTLEKNGIVKDLGEGRYEVSAAIIEQGKEITKKINEREKKRFYPRLEVLSAKPPEQLVHAAKKTWLDKELFKQGKDKASLSEYDAKIQEAFEQRKEWLVQHNLGLIQSNGQFALRDGALLKLDKLEVYTAGARMAEKTGLVFNEQRVKEKENLNYLGYVDLESGTWAIVTNGKSLQMAQLKEKPDIEKGSQITFKEGKAGKFEIVVLKAQEKSKEIDQEKER